MQNYIFNLVINSIKYQKKKYILLLVGIVLSVVLCNSVLLIVKNINQNQLENNIKSSGDYHFGFVEVKEELLDYINKDKDIDEKNISLLLLEPENLISKIKDLRIDVVHANEKAYRNILSQIEIKQGRLPKSNKEIIIEEWISRRNNIKLGDKIDTVINGKKISYTIVGYYQNFKTSQYNQKTNCYTLLEGISERVWKKDKIFNIYFKLKPNLDIEEHINKYKKMVGQDNFEVNKATIELIKGTKGWNENDIISVILIVPIIIISIAMILNIFNISILEKVKYFGMLKMIGVSQVDIIKIVLLEAMVLGVIGYPIGVIISIIFVKWLLPLFNLSYIIGDNIRIFGGTLLISGLALLITMIVSAFFPARFAAKLVPLDAVFQKRSVVVENIKGKKIKGFFNSEKNVLIDMANKNIKRNKKRYIITIFSIMISVILVVVYGSYYSMICNIMDKQLREESTINTKIYKADKTPSNSFNGLYNRILELPEVENVYKTYKGIIATSDFKNENNMLNNTLIQVYDSKRLKSINKDKYFLFGKNNIEEIEKGEGALLIYKDISKSKNIKIGSKINVKLKDNDSMHKLKISGVLNTLPFDMKNEFEEQQSNKDVDKVLIINEEVAKKVFNIQELQLSAYDIVVKPKKDTKEYKNKIKEVIKDITDVKIVELDDIKNKADKILSQVNLLIVLFLGFILIIAFLNLFNTISTNIIIRRREFGVLKAIGLSGENIKKMIYIEGMLCSIKGTVYGMIISIFFVYVIKSVQMKNTNWSIPVGLYIIPICFSLAIGYFSTLIPMKTVNNSNIIELIKTEEC